MGKDWTLEEIEALPPKKEYSLQELDALEQKKPSTMIKAVAESLPVAGGMFGGALGTTLGPAGTFGGAVAGSALGKSLENLIESKLLDEEKTSREVMAEPIKAGAEAAFGEGLGPLAAKGIKGIGLGIKRISSNMSGIPEKVIETYYKSPQAVAEIGEDIVGQADKIRQEGAKAIESFKSTQNARISRSIDLAKNIATDVSGVKKSLEEAIGKLRPIIDDDKIVKLQKQLDMVNEISVNDKVSALDMYALQKHFQELADYLPPNQMLKKKDFVDISLQKAATRARQQLKSVAPEIADANQQIAKLRRMETNINKNIITPEKPYQAMIGAGSGQNERAAMQLQKLGEIVNYPYLEKSRELAAAQTLNTASILPSQMTGARTVPLMFGGLGLMELASGNPARAAGMLATGAMSTPLGVKTGTDIARGVNKVVNKDLAKQAINRALQFGVAPYAIEQMVKKSDELSPSEKALLRQEAAKATK